MVRHSRKNSNWPNFRFRQSNSTKKLLWIINRYVTLSYNMFVVLLHIELQMLHKKGGLQGADFMKHCF